MKICVCIKEVPDSDVPSNKLKIDHENLRILPSEKVPSIVNGFDLNAVELALRFSENFDNGIGIRLPLGIEYALQDQPLELYMDMAPTINIEPSSAFFLSSSMGVRYFF